MANEIIKVTDQNGVDHPIKDAAAFPRSEQAVLGAKNVGIGAFSSPSAEGVAFTANSNNTVGVVAGSTHITYQVNSTSFTASVSGMFKYLGGIADEAVVFCWDTTTNSRPYTSPSKTTAQSNNSKGKEDAIPFYMEEGHAYQLICRVSANVEVTGTFYPMIICETETDLSYVPPAMTNKELTEKVARKVVLSAWDNYKAVDDIINLSEDISHFSLISFILCRNNSESGIQAISIPYSTNAINQYLYLPFIDGTDSKYVRLLKVSNTQFKVVASNVASDGYGLRQVIGIV